MKLVITLLITIAVLCSIYEAARKKYEVFGAIIVPGEGGRVEGLKRFRSEKKALQYYHECENKYRIAHIRQM